MKNIPRVCQYSPCRKPFMVYPSQLRKGAGIYCSRACMYASFSKPIPRVCRLCRRDFLSYPAQIQRGNAQYCSRYCYDSAKRFDLTTFWQWVSTCLHGKDCPFCCWPWKLPLKNGYGYFQLERIQYYAHRTAWEIWHNRPIPHALFVAHYCHNRACCNPDHIHAATPKENIADSIRDGRMGWQQDR